MTQSPDYAKGYFDGVIRTADEMGELAKSVHCKTCACEGYSSGDTAIIVFSIYVLLVAVAMFVWVLL